MCFVPSIRFSAQSTSHKQFCLALGKDVTWSMLWARVPGTDKGLLIYQLPKGVLGGGNWLQFSVLQGGK